MFCPNCGSPAQNDESACTACGTVIVAAQTEQDVFGFDEQPQTHYGQQSAPQETREKRLATNALVNGVIGILFSIWTLATVRGLGGFSPPLVLIFIGVDFTCSIPAIYNAIRGRSHNQAMFITALVLGILSTAASLLAFALWFGM